MSETGIPVTTHGGKEVPTGHLAAAGRKGKK